MNAEQRKILFEQWFINQGDGAPQRNRYLKEHLRHLGNRSSKVGYRTNVFLQGYPTAFHCDDPDEILTAYEAAKASGQGPDSDHPNYKYFVSSALLAYHEFLCSLQPAETNKPLETELEAPQETKGDRGTEVSYNTGYIDFDSRKDEADEIGEGGERFIAQVEREMLAAAGRKDLALAVVIMRDSESNAAPYDIASFNPDGTKVFVEVKTSVNQFDAVAYISRNELAFWRSHQEQYRFYRVYNYDKETGKGQYELIDGTELEDSCVFIPIKYAIEFRSS